MAYIGRMEGYWIGKESTRGTAVSPDLWIPHTEASFQDKIETQADESSIGVLLNSTELEKTKQYSEGEIKGMLATNGVGYLLLAILGQVTSNGTVWGGGAFEHDFSMSETNSKPSFTITKKTPLGTKQFALGMLSALNITANVGEAVMVGANVMAKAGEDTTATKAYAVDNKLYAKHLRVKIGDTIADLDSASGSCFETIELALTQELEDEFCFNSGSDLGDIFNKSFGITGSISRIKSDLNFETYAKDSVYKAMRIEIIDTNVTIGTSDNPTVRIDLARVSFEMPEDDNGLDEVVRESIAFTGHYDVANSKDIDVKVINTITSY